MWHVGKSHAALPAKPIDPDSEPMMVYVGASRGIYCRRCITAGREPVNFPSIGEWERHQLDFHTFEDGPTAA